MGEIHRYSKRILNPFCGTIQILDYGQTRATSTDGVNWRILILREIFQSPWSSLAIPAHYDRYYVFGLWSQHNKLKRLPVHPTLYAQDVEQQVQALIEVLPVQQFHIPFPACDEYECWLLDEQHHVPIALIKSLCAEEFDARQFPRHLQWYACALNEAGFDSVVQATAPAANNRETLPGTRLNEAVYNRTGRQPLAVWVQRDKPTSGKVISSNCSGNAIPTRVDLPELIITENWVEIASSELCDEYLHWMSARLLTLPRISDTLRQRLEQQAQASPHEVARYYRLYPKVLDKPQLKKILVEAQLRRANEKTT